MYDEVKYNAAKIRFQAELTLMVAKASLECDEYGDAAENAIVDYAENLAGPETSH